MTLAENKENEPGTSPAVQRLVIKGKARNDGLQGKQLPLDTLTSPRSSEKKKIGEAAHDKSRSFWAQGYKTFSMLNSSEYAGNKY